MAAHKELAVGAVLGLAGWLSFNIQEINEWIKLISGTAGSVAAVLAIIRSKKQKPEE